MAEASQSDEYTEPPHSYYFPEDFVARAPMKQGLSELHNWIGNNMGHEISRKVGKKGDHGAEKVSLWTFRVLDRYAQYTHQILTYQEPEIEDKRKEHQQQFVEGERGRKPRTLEQLKERRFGMELIIHDLGLTDEQKVIDYLYNKVASIPAYGEQAIEGQARLVSSTPITED